MLFILAGPALSGKSTVADALIQPARGDVLIDYSRMYSAMTGVPRGELRPSTVPIPWVQAVRENAITEAASRELSGVVTLANGQSIDRVQALAEGAPVVVVDMPRSGVDRIIAAGQTEPEARARITATWREECGKAAGRWFDTYLRRSDHVQMGDLRGGFRLTFGSKNERLKATLRSLQPYGLKVSPDFGAWVLERMLRADPARGRELVARLTEYAALVDGAADVAEVAAALTAVQGAGDGV